MTLKWPRGSLEGREALRPAGTTLLAEVHAASRDRLGREPAFKQGLSRSSTVDKCLLSTCCAPTLCHTLGSRTLRESAVWSGAPGHPESGFPHLATTCPYSRSLRDAPGPAIWDKNTQGGKGIHPQSRSRGAPAQCDPPHPLAAAPEKFMGVGSPINPLPSGSPKLLAPYRLSGSHSWLGPQRVERESPPGHPFLGEAKDKV